VTDAFAGEGDSGPGGGDVPCHFRDFWTLFYRSPCYEPSVEEKRFRQTFFFGCSYECFTLFATWCFIVLSSNVGHGMCAGQD
jgi:hypothetical protein